MREAARTRGGTMGVLVAAPLERVEHLAGAVREAGEDVWVANVDARPYGGDCDWTGIGTRRLTSPVLWEESVRTLTDTLGCRRLVELGPGRTLAGLIRRIAPGTEVVSGDGPGALD
ncbi:hypothetical protein [Streptomyces taklimakanensis]|uniref:hypothetical protein n=1 Tax=Streptomyces taklimakanensis TaxID=2569853 RepID=UPI003083FB83